MSDWKLPWQGRCRCGETQVRVTKAPLMAAICHCTGCQTMSASAFSLTLTLPGDGLDIVAGNVVKGGAQPQQHHHFCSSCKTWMFTRPDVEGSIANLRPSVLDDHHWVVPFIEVMTSEKLPWVTNPAKHSFDGFPELADYQALMEEYQREGARPS